MIELDSAVRNQVAKILRLKAVVINEKGDVSVDGVQLLGLDGKRTFELFNEGVIYDIAECGFAKTTELLRRKARTPGSLGNALQASARLSRMLDVDTITGR